MSWFIREKLMEGAGNEGGEPGGGMPADTGDAGDGGAGDAPVNIFQSLPETWRQDWVTAAGVEGDDAVKYAKQLERVADPGTFLKNYVSAQDKIRSGQLSSGLPADPTPEQLTEWRAANDVPEEASAYNLQLPEGTVLGEEDKAILEPVLAAGHALNLSNKQASAMVASFLEAREAEIEGIGAMHLQDKQRCEQALAKVWGPGEMQVNRNILDGWLNGIPEAVREGFKNATLGDGRMLMNSPEMWLFMVNQAREMNPLGSVVPNSANPAQAVDDELADLKKRMGTPEWYKDTAAQARYRELLQAKEKMRA